MEQAKVTQPTIGNTSTGNAALVARRGAVFPAQVRNTPSIVIIQFLFVVDVFKQIS